MTNRVVRIDPQHVEDILGNLMVIAIAGAVHRLQLPLEIEKRRRSDDEWEIHISYPEFTQEALDNLKEEMRSELKKSGLDILVIRRMMRMLYGKTVEEP